MSPPFKGIIIEIVLRGVHQTYSRCARFRRGSDDSTDAVLNSPEAASIANRLSMT